MSALNELEQRELLDKTRAIWIQLLGPEGCGWPQLGQNEKGQNRTPVDALAAVEDALESPRK